MPLPQAPDFVATKFTYAGLFLVALATLMYEILLTRIFSVTMYYHFAFVAISVAMFGMTVGAMIVYLNPALFTPRRARSMLSLSTFLFAITSVLALVVHLMIPAFSGGRVQGFNAIAPTYVLCAVPFVFSGLSVCLVLTRHSSEVSRLYAADLAGAALGCLGTIAVLRFTDGPTAVLVVSAIAAIASALFAIDAGSRHLKRLTVLGAIVLALLACKHVLLVWDGAPILRLFWVKGMAESAPTYEKWNSFSRVTVTGVPGERSPVTGWGLSPFFPLGRTVDELYLRIDSSAGTPLTGYSGDPRQIEHLKFDIVNLAHYLRRDADVLVVGAGGGRDLLSALAFNQRSATGVEINENIIKAVTVRFADFTGHLDSNPRIKFVNDEARSYIARQTSAFDIMQISLIDTWAATAAGAFVLSENSLYTVEAWRIFLQHLKPGGILTISRWYFSDHPNELYRVAGLANTALTSLGIGNPREHILIARLMRPAGDGASPDGVGTVLVSPTAFSREDIDRFERITRLLGFEVALSPRFAIDEMFEMLSNVDSLGPTIATYPLNISPTTDDSPFFFHMLRLSDALDPVLRAKWEQGANRIQLNAVAVLATLLVVVAILTVACIGIPLAFAYRRKEFTVSGPLFVYFASIGVGFMLVEISQMQRLVVFLGHPTFALSVVLFSLLLSSGIGSYLTRWLGQPTAGRRPAFALFGLLSALALFGFLTPRLAAAFEPSATSVRILLASAVLCLLGLFMGMAFPIGLRLAASFSAPLTPWLWGVNGATSVLASVLGIVIALSFGISMSFWTGFAAYALATLAFLQAARHQGHSI